MNLFICSKETIHYIFLTKFVVLILKTYRYQYTLRQIFDYVV